MGLSDRTFWLRRKFEIEIDDGDKSVQYNMREDLELF